MLLSNQTIFHHLKTNKYSIICNPIAVICKIKLNKGSVAQDFRADRSLSVILHAERVLYLFFKIYTVKVHFEAIENRNSQRREQTSHLLLSVYHMAHTERDCAHQEQNKGSKIVVYLLGRWAGVFGP